MMSTSTTNSKIHRTGSRDSSDGIPNTPSSSNRQRQDLNRRKRNEFLKTLTLGFVLGIMATRMFNLIYLSDTELQTLQKQYDEALNHVPQITPIDDHKVSSSSSQRQQQTSPKVSTSSSSLSSSSAGSGPLAAMKPFSKYDKVVIATKLHGSDKFEQLQQSLCLLHAAYNQRVLYDILIFTSTPLTDTEIQTLQTMVHPANLKVVVDNPGLRNMLYKLTPNQQQHLLQRCVGTNKQQNLTSLEEITWKTKCHDVNTLDPLQYTWQAEFRTLHIWTHPALTPYRYMLWLDTDGFCTHVWQKDPIHYMIQNNLVLMFDNFPAGNSKGKDFIQKIVSVFGHKVCDINLHPTTGQLYFVIGNCINLQLKQGKMKEKERRKRRGCLCVWVDRCRCVCVFACLRDFSLSLGDLS